MNTANHDGAPIANLAGATPARPVTPSKPAPSLTPLIPLATLGVMGGGQLGRMFVHAAQQMGYTTAVLDPDAHSPAGRVSHCHVQTAYGDLGGLAELARRCDAVTTEFENVPADALATLAQSCVVSPGAAAVRIAQDRLLEKAHFVACGVPVAPHAPITSADQLAAVPDHVLPGILKTARMGYDGKGQVRVADRVALALAWEALGCVPCILEKLLPLLMECSVVLARGADGQCVHFAPQRNLHRDGILAVTEVYEGNMPATHIDQALAASKSIADGLDYVGVLCCEFFVVNALDGDADAPPQLIVNEIAPRPHNSGHYTIDACDVSQFDLQVRTLARLPLVAPRHHSAAIMLNLLGDIWPKSDANPMNQGQIPVGPDGGIARENELASGPHGSNGSMGSAPLCLQPPWDRVLALPGVHLHLYGKDEARPGRKMGHLTVTGADIATVRATALAAAAMVGIAPW